MTPTKAMERVRDLLALSASPFEEEARTSALLACKLILEYGLELAVPVDTRTGIERARDANRAYRASKKAA